MSKNNKPTQSQYKDETEKILKELNTSTEEMLDDLYKQIVSLGKLPFELKKDKITSLDSLTPKSGKN